MRTQRVLLSSVLICGAAGVRALELAAVVNTEQCKGPARAQLAVCEDPCSHEGTGDVSEVTHALFGPTALASRNASYCTLAHGAPAACVGVNMEGPEFVETWVTANETKGACVSSLATTKRARVAVAAALADEGVALAATANKAVQATQVRSARTDSINDAALPAPVVTYDAAVPAPEPDGEARFPRAMAAMERLQGALRSLWGGDEEGGISATGPGASEVQGGPATQAAAAPPPTPAVAPYYDAPPSIATEGVNPNAVSTAEAGAYPDDPTAAPSARQRLAKAASSVRDAAANAAASARDAAQGIGARIGREDAAPSSSYYPDDPTAAPSARQRLAKAASSVRDAAGNAAASARDAAQGIGARIGREDAAPSSSYYPDDPTTPDQRARVQARAASLASGARARLGNASAAVRERVARATETFKEIQAEGVATNETVRAKATDAVARAAAAVREGFAKVVERVTDRTDAGTGGVELGEIRDITREDVEYAVRDSVASLRMALQREPGGVRDLQAEALGNPARESAMRTTRQSCRRLDDGGSRCTLPKTVPDRGQCTVYSASGNARDPLVFVSTSAPFDVRAAELKVWPAESAAAGGVWLEAPPSAGMPAETAQVVLVGDPASGGHVAVRSQRLGGGPPTARQGPGAASLRSLLTGGEMAVVPTDQRWRRSSGSWTLRFGDVSGEGMVYASLRLCGYEE